MIKSINIITTYVHILTLFWGSKFNTFIVSFMNNFSMDDFSM